MSEFIFTHPGVKFRERDLTFVVESTSLTSCGLVGETIKGPAFEVTRVTDKDVFKKRFGGQSTKRFQNNELQYQLPYAANAYLEESSDLYVTRVLGLSGYDAGAAWAITMSGGVDLTTVVEGSSTTTSVPFTNNTYLGVTLLTNGATGTFFGGYTKTSPTSFSGERHDFIVTTYNPLNGSGTVDDTVTPLTANSLSEYENMVLAVIRSRGSVIDNVNSTPTTNFDSTVLEIINNTTIVGTGDLFGDFTLRASTPSNILDLSGPEEYIVSLNPNSSNYISNVIGVSPKDKKTKIYVQEIYPDLIKKLDGDGFGYGINTTMIKATTQPFTNYRTKFKTPSSPWVVSQLKGSNISRLFKFYSFSDGDSANKEIKISIANINPVSNEFDVYVRDFYDTDASPIILESFTRCNLIPDSNNFIGRKIGTIDGEHDTTGEYIYIELGDEIEPDLFPCGFEGYYLNNFQTGNTGSIVPGVTPKIFYKTSYEQSERISRVYLGLSPAGYNAQSIQGKGINQNMFNFNGWSDEANPINFTKTKGFHMDIDATGTYYDGSELIGSFEVGSDSIKTSFDVLNPTNKYNDIKTRKFSLCVAGGFDGWDVHRGYRSFGDNYREGGIYDGVDPGETPLNDFQAWETAINTFSKPENVTINIFATPGINWSDNNVLVQDTVEMLETKRTDTLYIIDSPDINMPITIGENNTDVLVSNEITSLLEDAGIDTSYACTYYPWGQYRDIQNNINVTIPPTGEVLKAIAYTDKNKFPWFAPAGLERGVTDFRKSKYRLSEESKGILYKGRINPMVDFASVGTAIFGQKTLQVKDSALTRINVRRLILRLKVIISNIAIRLVFDQNDQETIDQFIAKVNPALESVKRERGLYGYEVKMDSSINTPTTIDRNELYGEIYLKPTRSLEKVGIGFNITPTGASFNDI